MPLFTEDIVPQQPSELLLEQFLALETLPGFRAEFIDGEIVVTPPPDGNHELDLGIIGAQFTLNSRTRFIGSGNRGITTPGLGRCIPDLTLAKPEAFADQSSWGPADGIELVAEVTSSRADRDRVAKKTHYALAEIPFYLLVDRDRETVTLFSEPTADDYKARVEVPFGQKLPLPEPFNFDLDTSELR